MQDQYAKQVNASSAHAPHIKKIVGQFNDLRHRHDLYRLFSDCMEMMALALSNSADLAQFEVREARYMQLIKAYSRDELSVFCQILAETKMALAACPGDLLGVVFGQLEVHNKYRGQFFTPYEVCTLMARLQVGDGERMRQLIESNGYVTVSEPACGAGAMVIAFVEAMLDAGFNPKHQVHVTAVDVDSRAAHMAYVQLSLMDVPAVIVVGNTLTLETREHWYTPSHVCGGWSLRLRRSAEEVGPAPAGHDDVPALPAPDAGARSPRPQLSLF